MASREFLKILSSARLGDVFSQQRVAEAYLTGTFKTPIQPANALIWLEKSYLAIKNKNPNIEISGANEIRSILNQIVNVPLIQTFNSKAFKFGWETFWQIARSNDELKSTLIAKWQLADLLLNPSNQEIQSQLGRWLITRAPTSFAEKLSSSDFNTLQTIARQYLLELADGSSIFTHQAKDLIIRLEPTTKAISSLWNAWLEEQNGDALVQAAELGLTIAKLTLGLRLAKLDGTVKAKSNASLKKAAHWLGLAAKDGDRNAWFALGEVYRRPQFSGYNAAESDSFFDRAADLGHAEAQFRKGANLWRKRHKTKERVPGLQASYWVWQANQQGVPESTELLNKILVSCPEPKKNNWYELAQFADQAINRSSEHKLDEGWLLLCHRIVVANIFNFSKAELLLSEVGRLQHEHCVAVDIRWELPKILPRLIQIETIQQRRALLTAGKVFAVANPEIEGNLRQRRYRFNQLAKWLMCTFSQRLVDTSEI